MNSFSCAVLPYATILKRVVAAGVGTALIASCNGDNASPPPIRSSERPSTKLAASVTSVTASVPADYANVVQQVYVAYFGRPADPGGLAFFSASSWVWMTLGSVVLVWLGSSGGSSPRRGRFSKR